MTTDSSLIRLVPYRQAGEPPRKAAVLRVDFPFSEISDENLRILGHLADAADCMNAIARHQVFPGTEEIAEVLEALSAQARREKAEAETLALDSYLDILAMQNSPWATLPKKNHLLEASPEILRGLADRAGMGDRFEKIEGVLFEESPLSEKANFYPRDLTDGELAALGPEALRVNTLVLRDSDGRPRLMTNEAFYREACRDAAEHLGKARSLVKDPGFRLYLDAKIEELRTGSEESRRMADYFWIRHDFPVDIIISTAIEVYQDDWKNLKGQAAGAVMYRSRKAEDLLRRIVREVPRLESAAPWTWRREKIDPETLPKIRFTDVFSWTGDYVTSPLTTLAQSLPNDEWMSKNVGTVNLVYLNTARAVHEVSSDITAREFLPTAATEAYGDLLFEAAQLHAALHEIGHTTGRQDPEHPGEPNGYLGNEYSYIEETRAELFGMWAAERIAEQGIIDEKTLVAVHYSMLVSLVYSLKFAPIQAHYRARNSMYHFFREQGALRETAAPGDGRRIFDFDFPLLARAVEDLLKLTADIKASGDLSGAGNLAARYCYTDPLKPEIENRTRDIPLGRALLFPEPRRASEAALTRDIGYPEFRRQRKFTKRYSFG